MKPLTIIGGGLAGLTLGIGLRQRAVPVVIWEAGHYPRHRVCGEFVNGRGQEVLDGLGLREVLLRAGARIATTAAFMCGRASSPVRSLPEAALCLSRYTMDARLATCFQEEGGELRQGERWGGDRTAEGIVFANGRRPAPQRNGARWFGLKTHAREVNMKADLEMYASSGGYVGLCQLADGLVNVCGLFRQGDTGNASAWQKRLRGNPGTILQERLGQAIFVEGTFCSVAGILLRPQRARGHPDCRIGDALTMIPPVTGNGMSMAFEAAGLAIEPLAAYSRGEIPWPQAQEKVAAGCDRAFSRRLNWAHWLQGMMMLGPSLPTWPVSLLLRWDRLWRTMFSRTR